MAQPAPRIHYPPALQDALAWLGAPPAADPLDDLGPMHRHLTALADTGIGPLQHIKLLELFEAKARLASDIVRPMLLDITLPVPKRLRVVAQRLMLVHRAIAAGYARALRDGPCEKFNAHTRLMSRVCAAGLSNLQQEYEIAQFISASPAPDFWMLAESLYRIASIQPDNEGQDFIAESIDRMKMLLALAAGQPEGFTPREIALLGAYLRANAKAVEILGTSAASGDDHYWLDSLHGIGPTASVRRRATTNGALHYRCTGVGQLVRQHLLDLARGEPPEALGLPHDLVSADYRDVLTRALVQWETPRTRKTNRRRHGYRVQVCTNLGRLWQYGNQDDSMAEGELAASEWMVINESASGYAIMHVAGALAGLVAGSAIGIRPDADKPWNICIVRWARSDNPEHIELGLELVSTQTQPVRIGRRNANGETAPLPALLLPPVAAIERGEALLTARGSFVPGPFALISETGGRIQIVECEASHLQMHTACVEIFEFDRKRIPE